jgi:prolyl oligopeptidase
MPRRSFASLAFVLPFASLWSVALAGCSIDAPPPASPAPPPPVRRSFTYPETPVRAVDDDYGSGVRVTDPYRWLEATDNAEVKAWSQTQNHFARKQLDKFAHQDDLRKQLRAVMSSRTKRFVDFDWVNKQLFALALDGNKQQPYLVVMASPRDEASARVVVDPNAIDPSGTTAIDWYVPSLDGKRVAVSLSKNGTEDGDLHIIDVATGKDSGEVIPHVNGATAGGSAAWNAAGTGLWYTRYPKKGERPDADLGFFQQVYFHELGKPLDKDNYELGKELPRIAEVVLTTRADGKWTLLTSANGDGGEFEHFLRGQDGVWKRLTRLSDRVVAASFGPKGDEAIYLQSLASAPKGKLLRVGLDTMDLAKATVVLPEGEGTIKSFLVTPSRLFVTELLGGPSRLRAFERDAVSANVKPITLSALPSVMRVDGMAPLEGDEILFTWQSQVQPPTVQILNSLGSVATKLGATSNTKFDDAEVLRETCKSRDGTQVPITIVQRKGTPRDGKNPTIVTGYGGFGISQEPRFQERLRVLLDQGVVWAEVNLRGGGELGEVWHQAGTRTRKQNVFDDFIGCAEHLIKEKVTSPEKLGAVGGSNGGLLMGAALTQRPDLFRAVVAHVGLHDMLRFETFSNGVFNVTEYGSVKEPSELKALAAYSPFHHVIEGTAYPAVLLKTATGDGRVAPWHTWKMGARLQSATTGVGPILILTGDSGHGIGDSASAVIDDLTDDYGFFFQELEVDYRPRSDH